MILKPLVLRAEICPLRGLLAVVALPVDKLLVGSNAMSRILREKFHKKPAGQGAKR